jgi:hypothetical protein
MNEPAFPWKVDEHAARATCGAGLVVLSSLLACLRPRAVRARFVSEDHGLDSVAKVELHQDPRRGRGHRCHRRSIPSVASRAHVADQSANDRLMEQQSMTMRFRLQNQV